MKFHLLCLPTHSGLCFLQRVPLSLSLSFSLSLSLSRSLSLEYKRTVVPFPLLLPKIENSVYRTGTGHCHNSAGLLPLPLSFSVSDSVFHVRKSILYSRLENKLIVNQSLLEGRQKQTARCLAKVTVQAPELLYRDKRLLFFPLCTHCADLGSIS